MSDDLTDARVDVGEVAAVDVGRLVCEGCWFLGGFVTSPKAHCSMGPRTKRHALSYANCLRETPDVAGARAHAERPSTKYASQLRLWLTNWDSTKPPRWVAGFGDGKARTSFEAYGDSPAAAFEAFDKAWNERLAPAEQPERPGG